MGEAIEKTIIRWAKPHGEDKFWVVVFKKWDIKNYEVDAIVIEDSERSALNAVGYGGTTSSGWFMTDTPCRIEEVEVRGGKKNVLVCSKRIIPYSELQKMLEQT